MCSSDLGVSATLKPELAPFVKDAADEKPLTKAEIASGFGIGALILLVLGGIWGGLFTPTEAGGVGAAGAVILGVLKGMRFRQLCAAVVDSGKTGAPIMFLLLTANMYAKFMEAAGMSEMIRDTFASNELSNLMIMLVVIAIWLVLGMILDSISIILLTVPVFAPIATSIGFDPLAFAVIGIVAIETGLLTPPFGILVFTVKAALSEEKGLYAGEIFRGALPYWILLLGSIIILTLFPQIATWLPNLGLKLANG